MPLTRLAPALVVALLAAPSPSLAARPAALSFTAPARVAAGEPFSIEVLAPRAAGIGAFSADVGYDPRASELSAALPLLRGGVPLGAGGRVGFYAARGGRATASAIAVVRVEPRRSGTFRYRIAAGRLYDTAGRLIARSRTVTLRVRVGAARRLYAGPLPRSRVVSLAARRVATAETGGASPAQAAVAAALFTRGVGDLGTAQRILARSARQRPARTFQALPPATWTVDSTDDAADANPGDGVCATAAGACSLRAAVTESNLHVGPDVVAFHVPANAGIYSVFQLPLGSLTLTDTTGGTTIDGWSQAGATPNTDAALSNAVNLIDIDSAGGAQRFILSAGSNVIRGLTFSSTGTALHLIAGANANRIVGNWIGYLPGGANGPADLNASIELDSVHGNVIGTPAPADRNVIGNGEYGIHTEGQVQATTVQGNLIGIGPQDQPSWIGCTGTDWNSGAKGNTIGGLQPHEGNHFAGGGCQAIELSHGYTNGTPPPGVDPTKWDNSGNKIQGNATGLNAYSNYAGGAYLSDGVNGNPATTNGRYPGYTYYEADGINVYDHSPANVVEYNRVMPRFAGITVGLNLANGNVIRGNLVGVDSDGSAPHPYGYGIIARRSAQAERILGNRISGANVGITLQGQGSYGDTFQGNAFRAIGSMFVDLDNSNDELGTRLPNDADDSDTGANRKQNFPLVTLAHPDRLSGTGAPGAQVEVLVLNATTGWVEPLPLVTVASDGTWSSGGLSLAVGQRLWALQTATSGDTSEAPSAGAVVAPATSAQDAFGRALAAGFGTADQGGPWTASPSSSFSVAGGEGLISTIAGGTRDASLPAVALLGTSAAASVRFPTLVQGTGADESAYVVIRRNGTTAYRARLRVDALGAAGVSLVASTGAETTVAAERRVAGLRVDPASVVRILVVATGSSPTALSVTVWNVGQPQPAAQLTASDATAGLQVAGAVGVRMYTSPKATNAPLVTAWDDLAVGPA